MEVHQGFHTPLADFRLIRRVGGVPSGVFQDIAQNHRRRVRAVIALADKTFENLVFAGNGFQFGQSGFFAHGRGQIHGLGAADAGRHDGIHQRRTAGLAYDAEHFGFVCGIDANVAGNKSAGVFKIGKAGHGKTRLQKQPHRGGIG